MHSSLHGFLLVFANFFNFLLPGRGLWILKHWMTIHEIVHSLALHGLKRLGCGVHRRLDRLSLVEVSKRVRVCYFLMTPWHSSLTEHIIHKPASIEEGALQAGDKAWWGRLRLFDSLWVINHYKWMLEKLIYCHSLINIKQEAVLQEVTAHFSDARRELRWLLGVLDHLHYLCGIWAILDPRRPSRYHFYYTATQGPYIGRSAHALPSHYLRRHPVRWSLYISIIHCLLDSLIFTLSIALIFIAHLDANRL